MNSMYFGALAVGADVAPGLLTFYLVEKQGMQINFAFKSMKAEFLKRAETDVTFICEASEAIRNALRQSMEENERVNLIVEVRAMDELNAEVAYFEMELSFRATLR